MSDVSLEELWCQCHGNASATPHRLLLHRQMSKLHAAAQRHALWYVAAVLALYLLGLAVIIRRSGRTERHTAASAISFCFSRAASTVAASRRRRRKHQHQQQQQQHRGSERREKEAANPQAEEPRGNGDRRPAAAPSIQVHLVAPDEDDEMEISMVTTVA